jgi:single-strand DNA-binding protein
VVYQMHIVVGNLGDTPALRETAEGQPVTNFSVAVNEKRGEREVTTWYRVTAWGRLAEIAAEFLSKGRQVLVEGHRLQASAYMDSEGQPQASLELTASRIRFLGSGPSEPAEDYAF